MALRPDARGIPVDHVVRYRRTAEGVALVVQPATDATSAVSQRLLARVDELIETERRLEPRTRELDAALVEVRSARLQLRTIQGILPMCMACGRARGDDQEWLAIADYLAKSGITLLSHGYCPACEAARDEPRAGA